MSSGASSPYGAHRTLHDDEKGIVAGKEAETFRTRGGRRYKRSVRKTQSDMVSVRVSRWRRRLGAAAGDRGVVMSVFREAYGRASSGDETKSTRCRQTVTPV